MVISRKNEEALGIAVMAIMNTGKQILEGAGEVLKKKDAGRRERRQVHIGTLASQMQEVIHMFILTKGRCRRCEAAKE